MCGIAAVFQAAGGVTEDALARAARALRHRGPDGQKCWRSPGEEVGLAHTRLAIIDLATGDQPLANEDGSLRLVVNGEFYGYEAIRSQLQLAGHRLSTATDSEIALHLYEDHGLEFLGHLRGEFALVLWDERRRRLLAARDRFGIKPLYYATSGGVLYLASEVKALQAMGVPLAWDQGAVWQMLVLGVLSPGRSLFHGVSQVPPGHCLLADASGVRLERYWDLQYPAQGETPPPGSDRDLIEGFHSTLAEAVSLRLRADVPVGCYLSGGLDSSSVLGLAARHLGRPLDAFTLVFDHASYDESAVAEETARLSGARWHPLRISTRDLADHFAETVWHVEGLLVNGNSVAKFLLSRAAAQAGIKVVLTGEGSDEVLAGYALFQKDLSGPVGGEPDPGSGLGFRPAWLRAQVQNGERHRSLLSPAFLHEGATQAELAKLLSSLDPPGALATWEPLSRSLYLWAKTVLPNYILAAGGDRVEMAHGVEGRPPFLDHQVAERAAELPSRLLFAGGTEKYVLREAARYVLSDTVYRRRKQPFLAPPASLELAGSFFECLRDLLFGPGLDALPFCDAARVRAEMAGLEAQPPVVRQTLDSVLTKLASLVVIGQRFHL